MRKRTITFIAAALILMCIFTSCSSSKSDCKDLISNLEKACNEVDISGILDCINPNKAAPVKTVFDMIGKVTDEVIDAVINLLGIEVSDNSESIDSKEIMKTIKITPEEYNLEDSSGTISCTISFEMGDKTVEKTIKFVVIKKDDSWYIDGIE